MICCTHPTANTKHFLVVRFGHVRLIGENAREQHVVHVEAGHFIRVLQNCGDCLPEKEVEFNILALIHLEAT